MTGNLFHKAIIGTMPYLPRGLVWRFSRRYIAGTSLVDAYRGIRFVATGSAAAALKAKSVESGAGRFTEFVLPPLTFAEYLRFEGLEKDLIRQNEDERGQQRFTTDDIHGLNEAFIDYLNFGGYPEAVFSEVVRQNPRRYIKSDIIDKVLLLDLPILYGISDIQELNSLFADPESLR